MDKSWKYTDEKHLSIVHLHKTWNPSRFPLNGRNTRHEERQKRHSNQEEMQHFVRLVTSTQKDFTLKFDNPLKISVFSSFLFLTIMIFYESAQTHTQTCTKKQKTNIRGQFTWISQMQPQNVLQGSGFMEKKSYMNHLLLTVNIQVKSKSLHFRHSARDQLKWWMLVTIKRNICLLKNFTLRPERCPRFNTS